MLSRILLHVAVTVLSASWVAAQASPRPFEGKWDIMGVGAHAHYVYWLEVKEENGQLAGFFLNRGGSVFKVAEISVQGDELIFTAGKNQTCKAKVVEGKLIGSLVSEKENVNWVGVRPPQWGPYDANAKHKLGKPVELFDGTTMDDWAVQSANRPSGWSVVEDVMTNEARANNLVSKAKFKDFKLRVEYKLEPKSNSGIYLRGRYELQVLDDVGKEAESHGHMAIYSRVKPLVNASKPAGEWQTMEATLVGNRVTVVLNGQVVHNNQVLEGITGGALDSHEGEPGPILLQGDHGRVWIRKATVTPIVE